jgi:hypothetical protein
MEQLLQDMAFDNPIALMFASNYLHHPQHTLCSKKTGEKDKVHNE